MLLKEIDPGQYCSQHRCVDSLPRIDAGDTLILVSVRQCSLNSLKRLCEHGVTPGQLILFSSVFGRSHQQLAESGVRAILPMSIGVAKARVYLKALLREEAPEPAVASELMPLFLPDLKDLTRSEQKILRHLGCGRGNQAIADILGIKKSTVKVHLVNIYSKLKVRNRTELVSRFLSLSLL
ncbi:response regulator transcription factor [Neptuniibacter halophilus]|uniref:response regulator transcription factor n=1 Tax=Neptuniibacter halophilus TaxID=651666 RepID=UPI002573C9DB|nr:LuxR C-terminal-related transcriptional regulator [Neptuniibacter halophilus]